MTTQKREGIDTSTIALSAHNWLSVKGGAHSVDAILAGLAVQWRIDPPLTVDDLQGALSAAGDRGLLQVKEGLWSSNMLRPVAIGRMGDEWTWKFAPLKSLQEKK